MRGMDEVPRRLLVAIGGEGVIIGHLDQAMAALTGATGTPIVSGDG